MSGKIRYKNWKIMLFKLTTVRVLRLKYIFIEAHVQKYLTSFKIKIMTSSQWRKLFFEIKTHGVKE